MPWRPGCGRLPIARLTDTRGLRSWIFSKEGFSPSHRFGITSGRSKAATFPNPWTPSTADFHARTLVLQELERVWKAADRSYFSKSSDSLANFDRASFSWKTSQLSLFGGLSEFSWSSLRWGTIVGGRLYQPQRWAPRILENGYGFLPTPTAQDYGNNRSPSEGATVRPSLNQLARRRFIPTPRASDGEKGGPNASDHGYLKLSAMAVRMPTPCARDGKDGWTPMQHGRHSPSVAVAKSGHVGFLNPAFVEVMMGYPIGWSVLSAWAMRLYRKRHARRSKG